VYKCVCVCVYVCVITQHSLHIKTPFILFRPTLVAFMHIYADTYAVRMHVHICILSNYTLYVYANGAYIQHIYQHI